MEQEGGRDLVQLWVDVQHFQQQLLANVTNTSEKCGSSGNWEQTQNDAMVIYEK